MSGYKDKLTWIRIIEPLLYSTNTLTENLGIFLADTKQGQDSPLANVGAGMVEHGD